MNKTNNNLLIIEDNFSFACTVMRRLSKYNYRCSHACDGSQALLMARKLRPNIVLLDMKLVDESGLNLIKPLRSLLPEAQILLLTGFASIATAVDAIKLGADDYLAKPVDTKTLLAAVEKNTKSTTYEADNSVDDITLSTEQVEWQHIQQVLKFNNGNISATARQLSMHRRTLQRKLQKRPKV